MLKLYGVTAGYGTHGGAITSLGGKKVADLSFVGADDRKRLLPMFAAAPVMLEALEAAERELTRLREQVEYTKAEIALGNTELAQAKVSAAIVAGKGLL